MAATTQQTGPFKCETDASRPKGSVRSDSEWFARLYKAFSPYVASIALRITGRDADVDDVVHDVFLALWRHIDRIGPEDAARVWLARATVRAASRILRRRRLRRFVGLDALVVDLAVNPIGPDAESASALAEVFRRLEILPVRHRLPWSLRFLGGEDLQSVADQIGVSLATVKRRIAFANRVLQGLEKASSTRIDGLEDDRGDNRQALMASAKGISE
jgi:RNA polymerase sigma-70 factor (ECF subfamily)